VSKESINNIININIIMSMNHLLLFEGNHLLLFQDNNTNEEKMMLLSDGIQMRWKPHPLYPSYYSSFLCLCFVDVYSGKRVRVPEGFDLQNECGGYEAPEEGNMQFLLSLHQSYKMYYKDACICEMRETRGWKMVVHDVPLGVHMRFKEEENTQ